MADEPAKAPVQNLPIKDDFPPPHFPTLYANSISSLQPGVQTTKFYLARYEPSMKAENTTQLQPFAQVVMPTLSFIYSAAFFIRMVENMIKDKVLEQSVWDQAKKDQGVSVPKNQ